MFEGLAWPKKNPFPHPYPLPLRVIWLQWCTVVRVHVRVPTGTVVWLTALAVSGGRGHMTSWSAVLRHPPRLLPVRSHSPFLPPLNHPSPFLLIPSSNPLLCFAPLSFWERRLGMGAAHGGVAHRWWGSIASQQGKQSFIWPHKMIGVFAVKWVQPLDMEVLTGQRINAVKSFKCNFINDTF